MSNPDFDTDREPDPDLEDVASSKDFNTEITVEEKAAGHVWHYAQLESEIKKIHRIWNAEAKRIDDHYQEMIESLQRQQQFWLNPVKNWWVRKLAGDPKSKKSFKFSSGTIKITKGREVVEIVEDAKAIDYTETDFVSEKILFQFDKKKIKEHIIKTGEILEFAMIVKNDDTFKIEPVQPIGEN